MSSDNKTVDDVESENRPMVKTVLASCGITVLVLGTIFNALIVLIKMQPINRHIADSVYKVALALVDEANLLSGLLRHIILTISGIDLLDSSDINCIAMFMHINVFRIWSAWILVALNVERCLGVIRPLRNRRTPLEAVLVCVVIYVVCLGSQLFFIFILDRSKNISGHFRCRIKAEFHDAFVSAYPVFNLVADCAAPILIFIVTHVVIVHFMKKRDSTIGQSAHRQSTARTHNVLYHISEAPSDSNSEEKDDADIPPNFLGAVTGQEQHHTSTSATVARNTNFSAETKANLGSTTSRDTVVHLPKSPQRAVQMDAESMKSECQQRKTFHFLLVLDMTYLVLVLPRDVFLMVKAQELLTADRWSYQSGLKLAGLTILAFLNNALNFVYYMASSTSFRKEFMDFLNRQSREDRATAIVSQLNLHRRSLRSPTLHTVPIENPIDGVRPVSPLSRLASSNRAHLAE